MDEKFRLKKIDETRNYLIEHMNWVTGWESISTFASLVAIPTDITSSTV